MMHGSTVNRRAMLHFAGKNIGELKAAFADTIADDRDWGKERGVEPENPRCGSVSVRMEHETTNLGVGGSNLSARANCGDHLGSR